MKHIPSSLLLAAMFFSSCGDDRTDPATISVKGNVTLDLTVQSTDDMSWKAGDDLTFCIRTDTGFSVVPLTATGGGQAPIHFAVPLADAEPGVHEFCAFSTGASLSEDSGIPCIAASCPTEQHISAEGVTDAPDIRISPSQRIELTAADIESSVVSHTPDLIRPMALVEFSFRNLPGEYAGSAVRSVIWNSERAQLSGNYRSDLTTGNTCDLRGNALRDVNALFAEQASNSIAFSFSRETPLEELSFRAVSAPVSIQAGDMMTFTVVTEEFTLVKRASVAEVPALKRDAVNKIALDLSVTTTITMNEPDYTRFTLDEYLQSKFNTECTMMRSALIRAGMADLLSGTGDATFFIPTDRAFSKALANAGYATWEKVAPARLRDWLGYVVAEGKTLASELEDGEIQTLNTLSGETLYVSQQEGCLGINVRIPDNVFRFAGTTALSSAEDLIFRDGKVMHIIDALPLFRMRLTPTDIFTGTLPVGSQTRLDLNVDTWVKDKMSSRADEELCCNTVRTPILWFLDGNLNGAAAPIRKALLKLFVRKSSVTEENQNIPLDVYDISKDIYIHSSLGTDRNAIIGLTFETYHPDFSKLVRIQSFEQAAVGNWIEVDITSFVKKCYMAEKRIPIALSITPRTRMMDPNIYTFGMLKETKQDKDYTAFKASYIEIHQAAPSALTPVGEEEIVCSREGICTLSSESLSYTASGETGVYSPNNIIYTLTIVPENGILTCNGQELKVGDSFTQEAVDIGIVKYYNFIAASDSFAFEVGDYTGSNVPGIVTRQIILRQ